MAANVLAGAPLLDLRAGVKESVRREGEREKAWLDADSRGGEDEKGETPPRNDERVVAPNRGR